MYKVVFTHRAIRDLKLIDKQLQIQLLNKIKWFSKEPLKYARKLISTKIGSYRFRIGDYRVIFDVVGENIVILRIGHRKDIYK
ncbi:MAG: type II toxin-antitoxin system RelE/ParE family toxin [bacterium]